MKIKKVFVFMILVLTVGVTQGQNNDIWLRKADSCLKAGDCGCAQGAYDSYKDNTGGRNKQIERRIADCEEKIDALNKAHDSKKYEYLSIAKTAKLMAYDGERSDSIQVMTISVGDLQFRMVYVRGGTFNMGAQNTNPSAANYDPDAIGSESPVHSVTLDGYFIGETEVTQALWREVMGSEPKENGGWTTEFGRGDNYPAYRVSYEDVQEFIERLNRKTGLTFRLPTEAEWEYAARGGNRNRGYKYSGSNDIGTVAWYSDNSGRKTHPVKGKLANELGLYDMSGNVWEWCQDWWKNSYDSGLQRNPQGPSSGSDRVYRGGGWLINARICSVSFRIDGDPTNRYNGLGFRLALVP